MIVIKENAVAKVIEDATIGQQNINMRHTKLENQKMKLINGSQITSKHACSAQIHC